MSRPVTVIRVVRWVYGLAVVAIMAVLIAWLLLVLAFVFGGPMG
jgi:hypothetical protein